MKSAHVKNRLLTTVVMLSPEALCKMWSWNQLDQHHFLNQNPCRWGPASFVLRSPPGDSDVCLNLKTACHFSEVHRNKNKANIPGSKDVLFGEINSRNNFYSENTGLSL